MYIYICPFFKVETLRHEQKVTWKNTDIAEQI
jgi:hypothetical protein